MSEKYTEVARILSWRKRAEDIINAHLKTNGYPTMGATWETLNSNYIIELANYPDRWENAYAVFLDQVSQYTGITPSELTDMFAKADELPVNDLVAPDLNEVVVYPMDDGKVKLQVGIASLIVDNNRYEKLLDYDYIRLEQQSEYDNNPNELVDLVLRYSILVLDEKLSERTYAVLNAISVEGEFALQLLECFASPFNSVAVDGKGYPSYYSLYDEDIAYYSYGDFFENVLKLTDETMLYLKPPQILSVVKEMVYTLLGYIEEVQYAIFVAIVPNWSGVIDELLGVCKYANLAGGNVLAVYTHWPDYSDNVLKRILETMSD